MILTSYNIIYKYVYTKQILFLFEIATGYNLRPHSIPVLVSAMNFVPLIRITRVMHHSLFVCRCILDLPFLGLSGENPSLSVP